LPFKLVLIQLYLKNNNINLAKRLLKSLPEQAQKTIAVIELEGRTAYVEQDYKQAAIILNRVYQEKPSEQVLYELVTALQRINLSDKALKLLEEIEEPNKALPLRLAFKQAELYSKVQPEKAIDIYVQLAKNTGNHYVVLNNLASLYLQQGNNTEALKAASEAIKLAPDEIAVQDTYALTLLATGDKKQAMALLANVYQAQKGSLNYKVHYAQALLANNMKGEAKKLLLAIDESKLDAQTRGKLQEMKETL
jgi:Tetratricopeptide repeat.